MADIKIYAPRQDFTGVVGGVAFTHGEALADEEKDSSALAYFRRAGYQVGERVQDIQVLTGDQDPVEDDTSESEDVDEVDEVEVPGMPKPDATRGQFAEFAEGMGLETEGLTKAQIVDAIKAEAAK